METLLFNGKKKEEFTVHYKGEALSLLPSRLMVVVLPFL